MTSRLALLAFPFALVVTITAQATESSAPQRLTPDKFPWSQAKGNVPGTAMTPGMESIYLIGDGSSKTLYSRVTRVPPHTVIQPHSHPDNRSCFVLSGMWYFGYGNVRDEAKLQALPPGSAYTEPARTIHFAGTKDAEAIVECTAMGPTDTYYVDPKNDPRNTNAGAKN